MLHLKPETLSMEESRVRRVRRDGLSTEQLDTNSAGAGSTVGAQPGIPGPQVRQQSMPKKPSPVSEEARAGTLGALGAPIEAEAIDEFIDEVPE